MINLPKHYTDSVLSIKIPMVFFPEITQTSMKCVWNYIIYQATKAVLREQVEVIMFSQTMLQSDSN